MKHRPQTNNHNTQTPTHTRAHTHITTLITHMAHTYYSHTHTHVQHILQTPPNTLQGRARDLSVHIRNGFCSSTSARHPGMGFVAPHLNCKIVASTPIFAIAHGGPPPANHKPMTGGFDLPITTPPPNYKIHQLSLSRNSPLLSRNSPLGLYHMLVCPRRCVSVLIRSVI